MLPTCYFPPNVYLFAFGLLALLFVFIWIAAVARFGVFVSIVIVGAWLLNFVSIIIGEHATTLELLLLRVLVAHPHLDGWFSGVLNGDNAYFQWEFGTPTPQW